VRSGVRRTRPLAQRLTGTPEVTSRRWGSGSSAAFAQLWIICAWGLQKIHHDPRPSRANRESDQIGVVNRPTAERPGVSRPEAQIVRGRVR
jgi:hypothetical protein